MKNLTFSLAVAAIIFATAVLPYACFEPGDSAKTQSSGDTVFLSGKLRYGGVGRLDSAQLVAVHKLADSLLGNGESFINK